LTAGASASLEGLKAALQKRLERPAFSRRSKNLCHFPPFIHLILRRRRFGLSVEARSDV
jgi:hypothetical protein